MELRKDYRRTVALAALSMTVGRGEVFGFLGPNGAGKTTAVKLLLGLSRPSGGEAMVLGAPAGDRETRRKIGYLPELFRYQAWLTAREVLVLHGRLLGLARPAWRARGRRRAGDGRPGRAAATTRSARSPRACSSASAWASRCSASPPWSSSTSRPAPWTRSAGIRSATIISGLRERGTTVFLNTHLLEEAEHVCDRVTVISKGRAVATGTVAQLRRRGPAVRLRVTGMPPGWWQSMNGSGRWTAAGDWLRVEDLADGQVPELVAAIVVRGGRVEAVVPEEQSLESTFLDLLGEE